ncbi:MAG: glycosyltransferase [Desulfobulbaceae bacterium]|nr:MAG: glycosyltransferase [Desulfobulbaceae bacterium]
MNILTLTGSLSRLAGGLFETVRKPAIILDRYCDTNIRVVGINDTFTKIDIYEWLPIIPDVMSTTRLSYNGFSYDFKKMFEKEPFDILHSHGIWLYQDFFISVLYNKNKAPYVVTPQGMLDPWALRNSRWKKIIAGFLYEKKLLKGATVLHSLNHAETSSMRNYGLRGPFCEIPNGIDLNNPQCSDLCAPWDEKNFSNKKILLYLGRIHPKKGLSELLQGWKHFQSQDTSSGKLWSLVIVGWDQGGYEADLKTSCEELGIEASVHFLGPLYGKDKHAALQNADAFILPSFSEGLPMAVLEAWQHKLPVIMTEHCNLPEGFKEGAALKIDNSPDSIARSISDLASMNEADMHKMGIAGYRLLESKFNWELVAADFHSVYKWILGGGSPPDCVHFE